MSISDDELVAIQERNQQRQEMKQRASRGPWEYDSWAFVHQAQAIPNGRRFGILVRPMAWFDSLKGRIDQDLPKDKKMIDQGYFDADYIAQSRDDGAEKDIDVLLSEVRRIRQ
jgi:hypothetical protein